MKLEEDTVYRNTRGKMDRLSLSVYLINCKHYKTIELTPKILSQMENLM